MVNLDFYQKGSDVNSIFRWSSFCYSIFLYKTFDKFIYIGDEIDFEAINLIRKANINIFIDLMGYYENANVNCLAKRLASKQISFFRLSRNIWGWCYWLFNY